MPKAFSTKNINKLKVYLEQSNGTTTDIKSNGTTNQGTGAKSRAN